LRSACKRYAVDVSASQPSVTSRQSPESAEDAATALAEATAEGQRVRIAGSNTKPWGHVTDPPDLELSTLKLDRVIEHNAGDLTAIVEAGLPLARAQEEFAKEDQRLSLDPPLGDDGDATIGGIVAAGDAGPLRSRYGTGRDLVVGTTVVLADGTVARSGGKVIKNVAGYDLSKLFGGSLGTLGLVTELSVRLHPRPERTATAIGRVGDPAALGRVAAAMAAAPLEHEGLDVRWDSGGGEVLARFGGVAPDALGEQAVRTLSEAGAEAELVEDDEHGRWERQRAGQRSPGGSVVRVSGLQTELSKAAAAAEAAGAVEALRRELAPAPCVVQDAPAEVRALVDPWGPVDAGAVELMRRVKERFDPTRTLNPGAFVGGI
jgi:glycolate oxidase FAD binding subunit